MPEIALPGCTSKPLTGCLKSLGVFRIIATQADQTAAGFWQEGHFVLDTVLSRSEIVDFFCDRYKPTPILNPWNGGSGFWPNDNKQAMSIIRETEDPRFAAYADSIRTVQQWPVFKAASLSVHDVLSSMRISLGQLTGEVLDEVSRAVIELESLAEAFSKNTEELTEARIEELTSTCPEESKKALSKLKAVFSKARNSIVGAHRSSSKETLLMECRARLSEDALLWFDAAIAIRADGTPAYNPVLGSGGNDGRNDFSKNFMEAVTSLLLSAKGDSASQLKGSLFQESTRGFNQENIGHFDPGRAGGFNQGAGPQKDSGLHPSSWDFVLTLEGATLLASAVTKRSQTDAGSLSSLPFTVDLSAFGFASATQSDKGKSELWFPIWKNPATLDEVAYLFAEGRGSVGRRSVRTGTEFCRAVGLLGVERGIDSFVRYAFIQERRGQSSVAMPVGEHEVHYLPQLALLEELDPILYVWRQVSSTARALTTPFNQVQEELFRCSADPSQVAFTRLVRALGRFNLAHICLNKSARDFPHPLTGLSTEWIRVCSQTPELRIAAAVASICGKDCPISANLMNTKHDKPWEWEIGGTSDWKGPDVPSRMASVLGRRLVDAEKRSNEEVPLYSHLKAWPEDAAMLVYGGLDHALIEDLLFGFMFIDWKKSDVDPFQNPSDLSVPVPRAYALLKLCFTPGLVDKRPGNPRTMFNLLRAGRVMEALQKAKDGLRVRGLIPFDTEFPAEENGRNLLAALLVPVRSTNALKRMVMKETLTQEVV